MSRHPLTILALALIVALAVAGCGASGTVHTTPTPTPVPVNPGHGVFYAFIANQGPTGPTSTDINALTLGGGTQIWHQQMSGGGAGAALGGGILYLGTVQTAGPTTPPTGTLQAFNANTGAPLWHVAPPSGEDVPVAANSDAVFAFAFSFGNPPSIPTLALTALRASDGTALWSANLGQAVGGPSTVIALGDGALYLVTMSLPTSGTPGPGQSVLSAVATSTGKMLWNVPLSGPLTSSLILSGGTLYLAVQDSNDGGTNAILAVQASDGKLLWSKAPPTATTVFGIAATSQTVCYSYGQLNGPGGGIVVLHAADGGPIWQTQIPGGGPVPFTADSSAVYALESTKSAAPTLATTLNVFDANTGKVLLSKPFPTLPVAANFQTGTPLQVVNGVLYVVGSGFSPSTATQQPPAISIILAFNTHDGSVLWQHQFNGSAQPGFVIGS
jgi:hypothetical protein